MSPRTRWAAVAVVALAAAAAVALLLPRPAQGPSPAPSATSSPPGADDRPLAVFLGDSYTYGAATELAGTGFPVLLGERRGWEVVNLGVNGTGYLRPPAYATVVDEAVALRPDVVVVSGGRNDLLDDVDASDAELDAAVAALFRELRAALPEARIVATSPLWDSTPTPEALVRLRAVVEREALAVGAEHVDLGDLLAGRDDLIADDALHPDEAGLALIAARIDALLAP